MSWLLMSCWPPHNSFHELNCRVEWINQLISLHSIIDFFNQLTFAWLRRNETIQWSCCCCLLSLGGAPAAGSGHNPPMEQTTQLHFIHSFPWAARPQRESKAIHSSHSQREEWNCPLLFFAVPQPPISSSPTNPNQADASLCLCVQFLIGGLYCYNTFHSILPISFKKNEMKRINEKKVVFLFVDDWMERLIEMGLLPP